MQLRINMERMDKRGNVLPSSGTLTAFEPPNGPGLRFDSAGYAGYKTSTLYDSLVAKLIVSIPSGDFEDLVRRAYRGLCEMRIEGVSTNLGFLQNLLRHPALATNDVHTRFVEEEMKALIFIVPPVAGGEYPV